MKSKLGFVIILILIQSYCHGQDKKLEIIDITSIEKSKEEEIFVHDVFDSLSIIHPSNVKEGLIGRMFVKSTIYKNFLIVGSLNNVQVFDTKGNFLFKTKKGKGPNEVQHLGDFTVDYDRNDLLVLDYTGKKVVKVNFNGEYTGAFEIKRGSMNLSYLGNNRTCYFVPFTNYQENGTLYDFLYIQDYDGVTVSTKKYKREIARSPWVMAQSFLPYKNGYTFKPEYSDTVLFINHKGFHDFKIFDFKGTQIPEKNEEQRTKNEIRPKHALDSDPGNEDLRLKDVEIGSAELDDVSVPEFELIDVESGLARVGGNKTLFLKLITKFKDAGSKHYTDIQAELDKEDWETATRVAHTLKGVAGNLGITLVFEASQVVETELKEGTLQDSSMDSLKQAVDQVLEDLSKLGSMKSEYLSTRVPEHLNKIEDVKDKIDKLKKLLEDDDAEAKHLLEEIGNVSGFEKEFEKMKDLIEGYDFDEALEVLKRLTN